MEKNIVRSDRVGLEYVQIKHPSGLTMLLCPMKGYHSTYALFGTNYGSVDVTFKTGADSDFVTVPEGIAHYLEHKLFENEDGVDTFVRYAQTGASANAFTSFDKTCYLFSCSNNFEQALEILLGFVTAPYFTRETVEKEQGIIGQEIKMYDDDPDWRVFFNLLGALYQNNPVRVDIAGTVESIAKIDKDLLYRCYNTFYNLHNMVLAIAGNFEVDTVLQVADRILKPAEEISIDRKIADEPKEVTQRRVEQKLSVAVPLFNIGFKGIPGNKTENMKNQVIDEVVLELLCGRSTKLYRELYDKGLINSTFGTEAMAGRDYVSMIISGESRDPDQVFEALCNRLEELKKNFVEEELFEIVKRLTYGRYIGLFNRVESVASALVTCYFYGLNLFDLVDLVTNLTPEQVWQRLKDYDAQRSALSVVLPSQQE